jgi:hypothetical protein
MRLVALRVRRSAWRGHPSNGRLIVIDIRDSNGGRSARLTSSGISIFELARVMGASVKVIDEHYGHLARDSEDAIRARLEARGQRSDVLRTSDGGDVQ